VLQTATLLRIGWNYFYYILVRIRVCYFTISFTSSIYSIYVIIFCRNNCFQIQIFKNISLKQMFWKHLGLNFQRISIKIIYVAIFSKRRLISARKILLWRVYFALCCSLLINLRLNYEFYCNVVFISVLFRSST